MSPEELDARVDERVNNAVTRLLEAMRQESEVARRHDEEARAEAHRRQDEDRAENDARYALQVSKAEKLEADRAESLALHRREIAAAEQTAAAVSAIAAYLSRPTPAAVLQTAAADPTHPPTSESAAAGSGDGGTR